MNLYTHAGVSKQNGEFKVRFANDALRVKVLAKNGHKDIDILELKTAMTKEDAVAFLLSIGFANGNSEVQAALEAAADKRGITVAKSTPKAVVKPKAVAKVKTAVVEDTEPTMTIKEANARIMAQLAAQEAAPF